MFLFYVVSFFKNGDTIRRGTLYKGGHYLRKYGKWFFFFTDYGVFERHSQVDTILGALEMEKEAFQKAQLFSWVFFPIWIIMAIVQAVCFVLSNGRFHPLAKILEDCDDSDEGKRTPL